MKKAVLVYALLAGCLGAHAAALGAVSPSDAHPVVVAENLATASELLMFFEEKDLVTATKRATPLRRAPAIATIITADEIRNMGARNLLDVLKMVPGFGVSINEFGTMMVEVRGVRTSVSEKILVMIDGHSLNRNTNGSAVVYNAASRMPVENIRQVEVVRGPGSALYGNSAFLATVNVITRNPEEINGLELRGAAGSFDTRKANIVGGKTIGDKLMLSGSLDHSRTDGPRMKVEADSLTGTPFSLAPGYTDLRAERTEAFVKMGYGDLSFRSHFVTHKEHFYIGLASALTDDSYITLTNYWGELAYALPISDVLSANIKLHYDFYEQGDDQQAKIFPNGFGGSFPQGMIGKPMLKNRTTGGDLQFDWDIFSGNHAIAGFAFEKLEQYDVKQLANFNPADFSYIGSIQEVANWNRDVTREIWALYLQDEWQLPYRVNVTAGVRYDHYSDFGKTINPRIGVVWSFVDNADVKLLFGEAFRAPNFLELYNVNNPVVVGNSNLNPETIKTYEAGLAWRANRFFAANLTYFYSTIQDQIVWNTATAPASYANLGKTTTQGVELGMNGAYSSDVYWKLTYAYQDPRDAVTDQRLPYVPSDRATGSINYGLTRYLNLHADLLWTGRRPRAAGDSRGELPAYTTVDVAVTLKNFFSSWEIQAVAHNIFDTSFQDPDTSGAAQKVPGDFPREGISALVTASCKF